LEVDVAFAPGMLSHIYGNRQLCLELLPLGWQKARSNNVDSVVNYDLGLQIVFQNVDQACRDDHIPQAISGKGAGSRQLVQSGLQAELWENPVNPTTSLKEARSRRGLTPSVWMFCVSDDGHHLRAELSKPALFGGNQFELFSRRIYLVDEEVGTAPEINILPSSGDQGDDALEFEVKVAKK
jgi:hypothetical protein